MSNLSCHPVLPATPTCKSCSFPSIILLLGYLSAAMVPTLNSSWGRINQGRKLRQELWMEQSLWACSVLGTGGDSGKQNVVHVYVCSSRQASKSSHSGQVICSFTQGFIPWKLQVLADRVSPQTEGITGSKIRRHLCFTGPHWNPVFLPGKVGYVITHLSGLFLDLMISWWESTSKLSG